MTPARVELHIEELVVHGVAPAEARRLGAAVERELTRLLAERGVPAAWQTDGGVDHLDGGSVRAGENLGADAARAVYGGGP